MTFAIVNGKIVAIDIIADPHRLGHLSELVAPDAG